MATSALRMTRTEFFNTVVTAGLRAALFLARELGVCLAQAQLWVRAICSARRAVLAEN